MGRKSSQLCESSAELFRLEAEQAVKAGYDAPRIMDVERNKEKRRGTLNLAEKSLMHLQMIKIGILLGSKASEISFLRHQLVRNLATYWSRSGVGKKYYSMYEGDRSGVNPTSFDEDSVFRVLVVVGFRYSSIVGTTHV